MRRPLRARGSRACSLLIIIGLVAACGGGSTTSEGASTTEPDGLTEVTLTLNFAAGGQHVGFVQAKQLGFYAEAGLDVTIQEGEGSQSTAQLVATGQSEFGFADGTSAMNVRAEGGAVKILAPVQQTNAFSVIALAETGIESVGDLRGNVVAVEQGTALSVLLPALLAANGLTEDDLEVQQVAAASLLGSLLEGQVAAILGGAGSQAVQLRERGADINVLLFRDVGLPTVGLSVITSDDLISESPDVVAEFVDASLRGFDEARKDPDAAAEAVATMFPALEPEQVLGQYEVNAPLFCTPDAETLGMPPPYVWETTYEVLTNYMDLPADPPMEDYYTTEFVPAAAPPC